MALSFLGGLSSMFPLRGLIRHMTGICRELCVPIVFAPKVFLQPHVFLVLGIKNTQII